jgi:hypothetical protein
MYEYAGNLHMHTPFSDGMGTYDEIASAALRAGLDFVIVTDHNVWVEGPEGYYYQDGGCSFSSERKSTTRCASHKRIISWSWASIESSPGGLPNLSAS